MAMGQCDQFADSLSIAPPPNEGRRLEQNQKRCTQRRERRTEFSQEKTNLAGTDRVYLFWFCSNASPQWQSAELDPCR